MQLKRMVIVSRLVSLEKKLMYDSIILFMFSMLA